MTNKIFALIVASLIIFSDSTLAQNENSLGFTGNLRTDQRFLLKDKNDWAWNENRLTINLDKPFSNQVRFHSEMWIRNFGLPSLYSINDLYNKGIVDPYQFEIREAYIRINNFPGKKFDLTLGRQHINWGTADKLNPTNNLNPYDLEDILDFGRQRGTEALSMNYYFNNDFSVQVALFPFFRPANMPVGIFSGLLNPKMELPGNLYIKSFSDSLIMPRLNLKENLTGGLRFKGFAAGIDFSLSYALAYDGLPVPLKNSFERLGFDGATKLRSELIFYRNHIIGADLATTLGGCGIWAEAAMFIPEKDVIMTNKFAAGLIVPFPFSVDSLYIDKTKPFARFIVGGDYMFADGSYLNLQYLHGFIHERRVKELNDYFFMRYDRSFFREKLKISPLSGGFIVTDWNSLKKNYAIVYIPEVVYMVTPNVETSISSVISDGKGDNLFLGLKDLNMMMVKIKYSF